MRCHETSGTTTSLMVSKQVLDRREKVGYLEGSPKAPSGGAHLPFLLRRLQGLMSSPALVVLGFLAWANKLTCSALIAAKRDSCCA